LPSIVTQTYYSDGTRKVRVSPQKRAWKKEECDETFWHIDGDRGAWHCAAGERPGCGI
jgi:hypothetical protein